LAFPVISKDSIKEVLFDQLGWRDREWSKMLGRASIELMYYFAQTQLELGKSVILENVFHPDLASPKLRVLERQYNANVLQIICNANSDVLFERFRQRAESGIRHKGHVDIQSLNELKAHLKQRCSLRLDIDSPVLQVDTTDFAALHYETILEQIRTIMDNVD